MSTFEVRVYKLKIEPHPNADTLEIARVNDYTSCVRKGEFHTCNLGVYLPEQAIVPDWMLEKMNLVGKLAGAQKNRIKICKLRGQISQGIVYPLIYPDGKWMLEIQPANGTHSGTAVPVTEGQDVADILGIRKYEPAIPSQLGGMGGKNRQVGSDKTIKNWDVESIKRYHTVLEEGEEVIVTEKLHGTCSFFGFGKAIKGSYVVHSKGLGHRGIAFKLADSSVLTTVKKHVKAAIQSVYNTVMNLIKPRTHGNHRPLFLKSDDEAADNVYVKMFYSTIKSAFDKMKEDRFEIGVSKCDADQTWTIHRYNVYEKGIYLLGETFGKSIQSGYDYGTSQPEFRCFDVYIGQPGQGFYLDYDDAVKVCTAYNIPMVPVIYRGPYSKERILEWTDGKETVSGKRVHIREGCVIKPVKERHHAGLGRVMLKSVSAAYLLKSDGEEFQ